MSPEDAARYIARNEEAFFNKFFERASVAGLSGYEGNVWMNIEKPILEEKDLVIEEVIIDAK